ncbi:MAG TPA: excinuclease ABC subunit UvrC [Methanothrix sp.]|nr:excinuclease ABC subunit UvrC [Methanothrix sp.]
MISLDTLPHQPGCYIFSDDRGKVLYVGKARDLKKRVASYFQKQDHGPRTAALVAAASSIDFIVTNSEVEALLLENTLIKKHQPRYNIKLKDSSRYAGIEITEEEYPRIRISRQPAGRGRFFGPFVSARERTYVYQIVRKTFGLRTCKRLPKRACLRYHLGHCSGPCLGRISPEGYREQVEKAASALGGRIGELALAMKKKMDELAGRLEYERALEIRNEISALKRLQERQQVERSRQYDQDVISFAVEGSTVYLMIFRVYRGTLEGKEEYIFASGEGVIEEFIVQYYSEKEPPEELILDSPLEGSMDSRTNGREDSANGTAENAVNEASSQAALQGYLTRIKGKKVRITIPRQGPKKQLLELARKNVETGFFGDRKKIDALAEALRLPRRPEVIECFDISHLAGTFSVGSMVLFRGGRPDKSQYRRFKIKGVQGIDDFASIAETVRRRYTRLKAESREMPDLIVIDGGKGQLSSALGELQKLRLKIPIISLAKAEEEIYVPGLDQPLGIGRDEKASLFLQEIRDEAHRFAIAYNRLLRKKAVRE